MPEIVQLQEDDVYNRFIFLCDVLNYLVKCGRFESARKIKARAFKFGFGHISQTEILSVALHPIMRDFLVFESRAGDQFEQKEYRINQTDKYVSRRICLSRLA
jgi:hypothetical protein